MPETIFDWLQIDTNRYRRKGEIRTQVLPPVQSLKQFSNASYLY